MARIAAVLAVITIAASIFLASQTPADGCAAVPRFNEPSITIAEESAIIVWDPVKKVQQFIRRAAFDTPSPDFGFLVPTPTLPETPFKEVEDTLFRAADTWMLPKVVEQTKLKFAPFLCMGCFFPMTKAPMRGDMAPKSAVRVMHQQKVGGYEVVVLEADSTDALSDWLKKHSYSNDPELQSWLAPYVAAKWKITAFKIMQNGKGGGLVSTKAVRMSFAAEKPFFPYREPEGKPEPKVDQKENGKPRRMHMARMLRVYFISDKRMAGTLGDSAWHATVKWSDQLTTEQRATLAQQTGVPDADLPATVRMTTFEDNSSPRPAAHEVYFEPSADQNVVQPPPIVRYVDFWIPADVVIIGVIVFVVVLIGMRYMWKTSRRVV